MSIGFANTYYISAFNHCKLDLHSGRRVSAMLPRILIDPVTHDGLFCGLVFEARALRWVK